MPNDAWNNVTTALSEDDIKSNLFSLRGFAVKIVYVIIGIVGVLDNLFVIIIFIFFIKIADKVCVNIITRVGNAQYVQSGPKKRYTPVLIILCDN